MAISDRTKELLKEFGMNDDLIDVLLKADEVAGKDIYIPLSIKNMSDEDFLCSIKTWLSFIEGYVKSGYYELPCYLVKRLSDIFEAKKSEMNRFDIIKERERNRAIVEGYIAGQVDMMHNRWNEDIIMQKDADGFIHPVGKVEGE